MLKNKKVGFIGTGNMGQAIIDGLLTSKSVIKGNILAYDSDTKKRRFLKLKGIKVTKNNKDLVSSSDVIILAVKPQVIDVVLKQIRQQITKSKTIISIAAGINTKHIEKLLGKVRLIRTMPNTPLLIREGITAICRGKFATGDDEKMAIKIFSSVGKTVKVKESLMDAVTALSGSGPAYVFLIIEVLIEAGIQLGLSKKDTQTLVKQTLLGATKMAIETGEDPSILRQKVTSPGGTTEAALDYLDKHKFTRILIEAVKVSATRARELGK